MIIKHDVEVFATVEIDPEDVLDKIDTETLEDELRNRDDSTLTPVEWDRLRHLLATRQHDVFIKEMTELVQLYTGRIVP